MRRTLMWLNLYGWETVRHKLKNRQKMHFFVFLGCFCAYVGQPYDHKSWATSMAFASINSTNPRTNPRNFHKSFLRIGDFESAILNFFFQKKNFFCFIPMKISHKLCVRMDGTQFLLLWWLTAKNECILKLETYLYKL